MPIHYISDSIFIVASHWFWLQGGGSPKAGKQASPGTVILDSRSVETATMIPQATGFDGAKLTKGRKRHVLIDTLGLLLMVVVAAANVFEQARKTLPSS